MMSIKSLQANNITQVLKVNESSMSSISAMFPMKKYGIDVLHMALEDHPEYELDLKNEIVPCLEYIKRGEGKKTGTLVVCTAGMSRSATVCIAYLMRERDIGYQDAFDVVKKARFYVNPNPGFVKFLKKNESKLRPKKLLSPNHRADCELCNLEKKTQWFENHTEDKTNLIMKFVSKQNGKSEFTVLLCDQCDCPIVVYTGPLGHHQNLSPIQF